jgi:RNA-directed DNA polymerase
MTSSKVRLEQIADPDNLREAFLRAAKGKAQRAEVIAFRENLGAELAALREEILGGAVRVGHFTAFTIFEPKERRIHAPCLRERVLHHALVGPCEADFERWLIADSYACRRGKGREAAVQRAEQFARRHRWFLKLDVRKYFDSIPHAVLLAEVGRRFRDRRVVTLWERLVGAYETAPDRGLPIGALTSQHLANFYLGQLDRFVKETLRVSGYVRYMDDCALWGDDKAELNAARRAVERFASERLGLALKPTWHLQPSARGMDFLGYRVFPEGNRLNRASRRRFLRRWAWCERAMGDGRWGEAAAQLRVTALTAFVRTAGRETVLQRLFGGVRAGALRNDLRAPVIGLQPRQPRRQLEQRRAELPLRQPQQERAGQPQQQPRLPPRPQLMPGGPEGPPD